MEYLRNKNPRQIKTGFFNRDALVLAQSLLGKVIQVFQDGIWLSARIIETEAYYKSEKGSHASLGFTHARRALFMSPGTVYMYYARGGDSLNFSCSGAGNAVLIKSAFPVTATDKDLSGIDLMLKNNPAANGSIRSLERLCAGQTLLCKALGLKVPDWNAQQLNPKKFTVVDDSYQPKQIIQTPRLGINADRDAHLRYRYIDAKYARYCTKNPLSVRNWQIGKDYTIFSP